MKIKQCVLAIFYWCMIHRYEKSSYCTGAEASLFVSKTVIIFNCTSGDSKISDNSRDLYEKKFSGIDFLLIFGPNYRQHLPLSAPSELPDRGGEKQGRGGTYHIFGSF